MSVAAGIADDRDATQAAAGRGEPDVFVGLDVGTTAAKATAFRIGGGQLASAAREYPLASCGEGREEQEPAVMVTAALAVLAEVTAQVGASRVAAIGCSTAMHGLIGLDGQRRPVTPLVTWADSRATEQCRRLHRARLADQLHRRSGTPVHPMSPLVKLMWFQEHDPATARAVRWWVGLKDYLLLRLTGELVTELSSASGTGLLDLATRDWSDETLALLGVAREQLPPVHPTTTHLPLCADAASRTGLAAGCPVVLGAGDGPLGNLGAGAMQPGVAGLSIGTSAALRMAVPEPAVDPAGVLFCYALTDQAWVLGGPLSNGGIVMRWVLDLVGQDLLAAGRDGADAALVELARDVPPGAEGLTMVPYLLAERAPLWNPELSGLLLGMRRHHTRGHLVRAAMEGVAMQLAAVLDALEQVHPVQRIRATGGVFRSSLWAEVLAGVLGRPLQVAQAEQGSALGAAALAAFALGRAETLTDAVALLQQPELLSGPVRVDPVSASSVQVDPVLATPLPPGQLPRSVRPDNHGHSAGLPVDHVCGDPELVHRYRELRRQVPHLVARQQQLVHAFPTELPA